MKIWQSMQMRLLWTVFALISDICREVTISLATKPESSKNAVIEGLRLLKKGGVMSLCIYSGGETGFEERDTLLAYLKSLDEKKYLVIVSAYYNRKNNPPIPVLIIKK